MSLRLRHYYMYEHPTSTVVDMPRRMRRRKERRRGPLSVPLRCGLGGPLGDPWGTKIGTQNRKEKKKKKSHQDFAYPGSPQLGQAVVNVRYCTVLQREGDTVLVLYLYDPHDTYCILLAPIRQRARSTQDRQQD